jgi:hypothetical protein
MWNIEVFDGTTVSLHVESPILVTVDCDISRIGLNDIKGKTDIAQRVGRVTSRHAP